MLQSETPERFQKISALEVLLDDKWPNEESYAVFCAAIAAGTADLNANAKKFADEDEPDYLLMSVGKARKMGVLPIGFRTK